MGNQGWFLLETLREDHPTLVPESWWWLAALGAPGLADPSLGSLPLTSRGFPPCAWVLHVAFSSPCASSHEDTSHAGLGTHPTPV